MLDTARKAADARPCHGPGTPRRFAFAPRGAAEPVAALRAALVEQGWTPGRPLTVVSEGEPAVPNLVRAATGGPAEHVLDRFHLAMRMRPIEEVLLGLEPAPLRGEAPVRAARVAAGPGGPGRRRAYPASAVARTPRPGGRGAHQGHGPRRGHPAPERRRLPGGGAGAPAPLRRAAGLVGNNVDAVADHRRRYDRLRPISTSRSEGCVDEVANARMRKRRRMRWSAAGADAVAVVRAAVLDGRLEAAAYARPAA